MPEGTCTVQVVGGGLKSDVKVTNTSNKKWFFIECKLDFKTSRYFKYGVKIRNGKPTYDYTRYISSAKKNDEDVKEVDELFSKCIDMDRFMKDVMADPEVVKSWKQFGDNVDDMCYWLENGDFIDGTADKQFTELVKPYMMKVNEDDEFEDIARMPKMSFKTGEYPENFEKIASVFDKYI